MPYHSGNAQDRNGNALGSATVTIARADGGTVALYSNALRTLSQANPITCDENGLYAFYARPGLYTLAITKTGFTAQTFTAELPGPEGIDDFGAKGDGITDDTAALNAAITATPSGGTLTFPPATSGYLISSKITVAKNIKLVFEGKRGVANNDFPGSYLLKKSTMTVTGLEITTNGVEIVGGGVVGALGNTGNGIDILANNVTLNGVSALNCGQDGIRIGKDATGGNSNTFLLIKPVCSGNGRHGIYINSDNSLVSVDANAGLILLPFAQDNDGDGIKVDAAFANTIVAPLCEVNTGAGLRAGTNCRGLYIFGGDLGEANVGGDFVRTAGSRDVEWFGTPNLANDTDLHIPQILSHINTLTGSVGIGFNVASTVEAAGSIVKGLIAFERTDSNGRGTMWFCLDNANDTDYVALSDGVAKFEGAGIFSLKYGLRPATAAGAFQTSAAIFAGSGAPSNGDGGNGDYYLRSDGTAAGNTCIYHKQAGSWVALVTS